METSFLPQPGHAPAHPRLRPSGARAPGGAASPERLRSELAAELEVAEGCPIVDSLLALGVTPATAAAFEALPLVEVAWADGAVQEPERWRVLEIATGFGLELGRPAHAQLERWLVRRPPQELLDAWYAFAATRLAGARPDRVRHVLDGAEAVAAASGGLFGFRAVSSTERSTLERIRAVLRPAVEHAGAR